MEEQSAWLSNFKHSFPRTSLCESNKKMQGIYLQTPYYIAL